MLSAAKHLAFLCHSEPLRLLVEDKSGGEESGQLIKRL